LKENPSFAAIVGRFVRDADTGIDEFRVVNEKGVELVYSEMDKTLTSKESTKPGLSFGHAAKDGTKVFFRRQQESSGTLRFVALLAAILQPTSRQRVVCIDEFSASMDPDLVRRLIRIAHSSTYNQLGSQLLFTTHDTHLIDPNELLRRDQIIICSKDRFGRSTIRRLDDFHDAARTDANLQKQYLQGRFGGRPRFGSTLEDVLVDDKPQEISF
jgi:predicted ATPase